MADRELSVGYIAAGGNRHPSAADWDAKSGLLAYGAGKNIALWKPLSQSVFGIRALWLGHTNVVNSIRYFPQPTGSAPILISGSADKTIRLWRYDITTYLVPQIIRRLDGHSSSINCIAVASSSEIFASGAADGTVKVWKMHVSQQDFGAELIQTITLNPRLFPLALALSHLGSSGALILAIGGTKSIIQVHVAQNQGKSISFALQATLTGHESWIRSLDFVRESISIEADLLLTSASQDKNIRLWRIHQAKGLPIFGTSMRDPPLGRTGKSLSNKVYRFLGGDFEYLLTFEALLLGHEDWVYTVNWNRNDGKLKLLSASADNSLAIWESDIDSGVWVCATRLGEISSQKGSTTATGSTGGFWIGLWSPDGDSVVSLGRTGSWRLWSHETMEDRWFQRVAVSGHIKNISAISWAKDGTYLLSTSSDQTTRLHAEWRQGTERSWHEFARPQIHGYDLNCIDTFGASQFISGADEKLLRVFNQPRIIAEMLEKLCGMTRKPHEEMADIANIPVLGLSNKAVEVIRDEELVLVEDIREREAPDQASVVQISAFEIDQPPFEDQLARHTLWPESEKLYGHGYEISAVTASNDGALIATACKASSLEHAVIRLYETQEWREIKPSLNVHSLTVTCLQFTDDDTMLLSVGRDRQWAVFERKAVSSHTFLLNASNTKGHSRMILAAAWAPSEAGRLFATAGRDKFIKLWAAQEIGFPWKKTISDSSSVTSVVFFPAMRNNGVVLAAGTESGALTMYNIKIPTLDIHATSRIDQRQVKCHQKIYISNFNRICPSGSITQLAWRPLGSRTIAKYPDGSSEEDAECILAISSEDSSLRLLYINIHTLQQS